MTDTTPEAVERLARVLDGPFYRVEGYAGPYIDEATLRDEHTAAAATLRALLAEVARLKAPGEPEAWGTGNALYVDDDPAPAQIEGAPVTLTYTNYRGETAARTITPRRVWFGSTEWHQEPQWLLTAFDHEKQADRGFALRDFGSPDQTPPTSQSDADFLAHAGMDAAKWASGFKAVAERLGHLGMDEGWLIGWFANAIMAGFDEAERRQRPAQTPPEDVALALLVRLVKWDKDYPVNCWNGYAGLKELDKIIADADALAKHGGSAK